MCLYYGPLCGYVRMFRPRFFNYHTINSDGHQSQHAKLRMMEQRDGGKDGRLATLLSCNDIVEFPSGFHQF